MSDEVLLARAFLSRVAEPAYIPLWDLVRRVGPVDAVAMLLASEGDQRLVARTASRLDTVDAGADLAAADRHGIRLVVPESDEWPHFALAALERTGAQRAAEYDDGRTVHAEYGEPMPPLALWVRGPLDLSTVGVRAAGIVGSRAATAYGQRVAGDLAYGLAMRDFTIVSGGAYGIDAAAHKAALAAEGPTVLVSAGGIERAYPPSHQQLYERVAASGLLVSESPPGSAPQRRRFLTRNRLIAALSGGTIVIEAARRSGAINTAGHAHRLSRPLMAVPGPVSSGMSAGCHDLIRSEEVSCALVTDVDDVLAQLGGWSDLSAGPAAKKAGDDLRSRLDELDPAARNLYDGLPARREVGMSELASVCGVSISDVLRGLSVLELADLVERTSTGVRRRSHRGRVSNASA